MLIGIDGPGSWLLKNTYVGWTPDTVIWIQRIGEGQASSVSQSSLIKSTLRNPPLNADLF